MFTYTSMMLVIVALEAHICHWLIVLYLCPEICLDSSSSKLTVCEKWPWPVSSEPPVINYSTIDNFPFTILPLAMCHLDLAMCHLDLAMCHLDLAMCHLDLAMCHIVLAPLFLLLKICLTISLPFFHCNKVKT